ncbi:hypothetical protein QJS10_CPB20g00320 [Acorus calamus]|uniref:Uncharacterized protein n=1 Tax=Acorus calamus TaxID=4465 RepID=A0AAV9C959_ACOCL|nr:hypothetical protein QJS10_CPB20g00320 [Acorus calamus]
MQQQQSYVMRLGCVFRHPLHDRLAVDQACASSRQFQQKRCEHTHVTSKRPSPAGMNSTAYQHPGAGHHLTRLLFSTYDRVSHAAVSNDDKPACARAADSSAYQDWQALVTHQLWWRRRAAEAVGERERTVERVSMSCV